MVSKFNFDAIADFGRFLEAAGRMLQQSEATAAIGELCVGSTSFDEITVLEHSLRLSMDSSVKMENVSLEAVRDGKRITFPLLLMTKLQVEFKVLPTADIDEHIVLFEQEDR